MVKSRLLLAIALFAATGTVFGDGTAPAPKPATEKPATEKPADKKTTSEDSKDAAWFAAHSKSKRYGLGGVMLASVLWKLVRGASRIKAKKMAELDGQAADRAVTEEEYRAAENYLQALLSQENLGQAFNDFKRGTLGTGDITDVASSWAFILAAAGLGHDLYTAKANTEDGKKD